MPDKLPLPVVPSEMYAHAALMELRTLNHSITCLVNILDDITKVQDVAAQGDEVELKEPEKKPAHRDALQPAVNDIISAYDDLTADEIIGQVDGLDDVARLRLARYEATHKNRVTVLNALR